MRCSVNNVRHIRVYIRSRCIRSRIKSGVIICGKLGISTHINRRSYACERFDCFLDAALWFHQRYNEDFGIVEAHVTSAVALSDTDREALRQKLEQMSKKKVTLVTSVDPSVIGGVRVEMDGKRYDNTIQNKLGRLRQSLVRGL